MYDTIVYVAGPYRAPSEHQLIENIRAAETVAKALWKAGFVALCPHMNTAHFGGIVDDEAFVKGSLELLSRCDAVIFLPKWKESRGSVQEYDYAAKHSTPRFFMRSELGLECIIDQIIKWRFGNGLGTIKSDASIHRRNECAVRDDDRADSEPEK